MNKFLIILVFLLLLPMFMMATDYYTVTADVLNVRNEPSKNGEVIGVVKCGQTVSAESPESNGWIRIKMSSLSGYVSADYLTFSHTEDTTYEQSEDRGIEIGLWGFILILAIAAIVFRLLRSRFEWMDYFAIAIWIIVPIVVWITNGFWGAVLAFFITSIILYYLFGIGNEKTKWQGDDGQRYSISCYKCNYEHMEILSSDEQGVYARCKRCGDTRRYNY